MPIDPATTDLVTGTLPLSADTRAALVAAQEAIDAGDPTAIAEHATTAMYALLLLVVQSVETVARLRAELVAARVEMAALRQELAHYRAQQSRSG